jgi:hypothetical protein
VPGPGAGLGAAPEPFSLLSLLDVLYGACAV